MDPRDDLSIDTKIRYGKSEAAAITFNAAFELPPFVPFGTPGSESFYQDVNTHEFIFAGNVRPVNEQDVLEVSVKADFEMDWATMSAWAFYSDTEDTFIADGTSGAFGFYGGTAACINSLDALTPSRRMSGGVTALPARPLFSALLRGSRFSPQPDDP